MAKGQGSAEAERRLLGEEEHKVAERARETRDLVWKTAAVKPNYVYAD